MKKIFSFWVLCLMAFATSALVSCSSDDNGDEWGGFKFENVREQHYAHHRKGTNPRVWGA